MVSFRLLLATAALALAPMSASAAELSVFAAASLADALKEIAPAYTRATGDVLRFNLGASGTLARQIREGAPAEVFFSADELRVDQLEKAGQVLAGTRRTLLANSLVVVVASDTDVVVNTLGDLARPAVRRVAIGEPATVPAGTYTKELLEKRALWSALEDKLVPLDNVRAVLAAVESGNADAGFVYKTDALGSKKVKLVLEIPPADGPEITYPAVVLKEAKAPEAARAFVAYLAGAEAQAIFVRHGFLPAPAR